VAIPAANDPKSQLRTRMRRILLETTPDSRTVHDALERWLAKQPGLRQIAVFAALPGEVDLMAFVARHHDRIWIYPRVAGDSLTFHAVRNPAEELVPGAFGIREPSPALAEIAIDRIDAFLCPGLAFDAHGGRLGRGRGFYDRMLAAARIDALKIGVCFASQIVESTFPEPHDVRMDDVGFGRELRVES
jgi:5-formyltetrahydrofolate cyclo-ligase